MKKVRDWMRPEVGLVFVFLVILVLLVRFSLKPDVKMPVFAQVFGDFAGTLVAAVALGMLIKTVWQQQEGLDKQQKGLEIQHEELQRTADAQQQQVDIAQMAARLNATASLLDSATQELASFATAIETPDKKLARDVVTELRQELRDQRDELAGAVEGSSVRTMGVQRNPSAQDGSATDEEAT